MFTVCLNNKIQYFYTSQLNQGDRPSFGLRCLLFRNCGDSRAQCDYFLRVELVCGIFDSSAAVENTLTKAV